MPTQTLCPSWLGHSHACSIKKGKQMNGGGGLKSCSWSTDPYEHDLPRPKHPSTDAEIRGHESASPRLTHSSPYWYQNKNLHHCLLKPLGRHVFNRNHLYFSPKQLTSRKIFQENSIYGHREKKALE